MTTPITTEQPPSELSIANSRRDYFNPFEGQTLLGLKEQIKSLTAERESLSQGYKLMQGMLRNSELHLEHRTKDLERVSEERDESDAVLKNLAMILASVAIALKGPELPLHRHGYHDLENCAQVAMLEIELLRHLKMLADTERDLLKADAARICAIQEGSWSVIPENVPTGGDDYEIAWKVIEHHMSKPVERVIGENFNDDLRAALDAAMAVQP